MAQFEQTMIIGRLGGDPETRRGAVEFNVAVNQPVVDSVQQPPVWYRVVCEGWLESPASKLRKGQNVMLLGRTRSKAYLKDGEPKSALYLLCEQIVYLDRRDNGADGFDNADPFEYDSDNVPF